MTLIDLNEEPKKNEVETGFEPVCAALQAVASPLGHSTAGSSRQARRSCQREEELL